MQNKIKFIKRIQFAYHSRTLPHCWLKHPIVAEHTLARKTKRVGRLDTDAHPSLGEKIKRFTNTKINIASSKEKSNIQQEARDFWQSELWR